MFRTKITAFSILLILTVACHTNNSCPSAEVVFGSFTDTRNNVTYRTVTINSFLDAMNKKAISKTWMLDNLCLETEAYSSRVYSTHILYNPILFFEKDICPKGWHLARLNEWNDLLMFLNITTDRIQNNSIPYNYFRKGASTDTIVANIHYKTKTDFPYICFEDYHPLAFLFFNNTEFIDPVDSNKIAIKVNEDSICLFRFERGKDPNTRQFKIYTEELETITRAKASLFKEKDKMTRCRCVKDE